MVPKGHSLLQRLPHCQFTYLSLLHNLEHSLELRAVPHEYPQNLHWCLTHNSWPINGQSILITKLLFFFLYSAVTIQNRDGCLYSLHNRRHRDFRKVGHKIILSFFSHNLPVISSLLRAAYFNDRKYVPDHRI